MSRFFTESLSHASPQNRNRTLCCLHLKTATIITIGEHNFAGPRSSDNDTQHSSQHRGRHEQLQKSKDDYSQEAETIWATSEQAYPSRCLVGEPPEPNFQRRATILLASYGKEQRNPDEAIRRLLLASIIMSRKKAMLTAARVGDLGQLQELLQNGVNVEAKNSMGYTSLISASAHGRLEVVKYLVEDAGANLEATSIHGLTPLILASRYGHLKVVKYFMEENAANVEAKDNDGKTALDWARGHNRISVIQYLEEKAGLPTVPSIPDEPSFSSNQHEFVGALQQWVQNVESILSDFLVDFKQWKERQEQSCQAQLQAIDEEIAREVTKLESKKATIRNKNNEMISKATAKAEVSVLQLKSKIAGTNEIIGNLGGQRKASASPSEDQNDKEDGPPSALCCPITLQLMYDPVFIVEEGHTYERSAILEHWRTQESRGIPVTSPCTNQRLLSKQLTPNVLARSQCREWMEQHPN